MEDIVHPVTEFHNLPWHALDPNKCTMAWSFRIATYDQWWQKRGVQEGQLVIDIIDEKDLHSDLWVCPEPLAAVVKMAQHIADDKARGEFRKLWNGFEFLLEHREPPCYTGLAAKMI